MSVYGMATNVNGEIKKIIKPKIDERVKKLEDLNIDERVKELEVHHDSPLSDIEIGQIKLNSLKTWDKETGVSIFAHAGSTPDGIAILRLDDGIHAYMTTPVDGTVLQVGEKLRISEWILSNDGSVVSSPVCFTEPLELGHGQDISATYENGQVYLWTTAGTTVNSYGGQGIARIEWHGASTNMSHVTQYNIHSGDNNVHEYFMTPCVSKDGSLVVFVSKVKGIEDTRLVTVYKKDALLASPSTATPIYAWQMSVTELRCENVLQGLCCDSKYIYTLHGNSSVFGTKSVQKWTMDGQLVRHVAIDAGICNQSVADLIGNDVLGRLHYEPEGLEIFDGKLVCLMFMLRRNTDVVTYNGTRYSYVSYAGGNNVPSHGVRWERTDRTPTKGEWSSSATYSIGTAQNISIELWQIDKATGVANEYRPAPSRVSRTLSSPIKIDDILIGRKNENPLCIKSYNVESGTERKVLESTGMYLNFYDARLTAEDNNTKAMIGAINTNPSVAYGGSDNIKYAEFKASITGSWNGTPNISLYTENNDNNKGNIALRAVNNGTVVGMTLSSTGNCVIPSNNGVISLGISSNRWKDVFAANGVIQTSDERLKDNISDVDDALMRAWGKVGFKVFQFKDAVAKKGKDARLHIGVIAQRVIEAFASEGLDATKYGLLCYDEWEDQLDPDGNVTIEAGNAYGIRYEEALALECAYQRWRLDKLEAKLNGKA